jgi:Zn-dependent peptidase ImmA (M78 family)/transcriptional regulator with XRE-family HTH domain
MVVGIASFQGERLKQARKLRRLPTMTALADLTGISKQVISRYESGETKPREEVIEQIATVLNLPVAFFLHPTVERSSAPVMFRSLMSALELERERAREVLALTLEAGRYLDEYVELPECTIPRLNPTGQVQLLTNETIEEAARRTRVYFGFPSGPLPNLVILAERAGILVVRTELATKELDGLSQWSSPRPAIVINSTKSPARSRFDLAHEIGHLVLHSYVPAELLESPTIYKLMEKQAHFFAGALLLPPEEFARDLWLYTLDEFVTLKQKWQVSAQSMLQRAYNLNLISEDDYIRMRKQINARRWREQEPLESVIRLEEPSLLRQSFEVIVSEIPDASGTLQRDLPFGSLLAEIATAPPGFLQPHQPPKLVDIRDYRRSSN